MKITLVDSSNVMTPEQLTWKRWIGVQLSSNRYIVAYSDEHGILTDGNRIYKSHHGTFQDYVRYLAEEGCEFYVFETKAELFKWMSK